MERLKISENGRYFVKQDGTPFTWLADTAWTIPQRMKWDDAEYYMEKRKSQGFTVLQIVALDPERDVMMRNPSGDEALLNNCLDTPNERYFEYLDRILDMAEEYGFYVLLLPVWGQLVVGENWSGEIFDKTVTADNAYRYGKWIGERYRERENILWCLGGDRQPVHKGISYKDVWRRMAEGLAKGVTGRDARYNEADPAWKELLMTYHACYEQETGECSTLSYWDEEEQWISFVMLQSGHGITPKNYELVRGEYCKEHIRPVWDGEPAYELMPTSWPPSDTFHGAWIVRKRAYWSLFAGAFGHTYGHASVWCTISEKEVNQLSRCTWYEALEAQGAYEMKYLRNLMEQLSIMKYVPAQSIVKNTDRGEEQNDHIQACINSREQVFCAYLPSGGRIELEREQLENEWNVKLEELSVWWYDPRCGTCQKAGAASDQLTAPTEGAEEDWVLILRRNGGSEPVVLREYGGQKGEHAGSEMKKVFEW